MRPLVVEESFSFHRLTGCSMETRGVVASYVPGDESLTIYQSHTAPHQLRSLYAMHLGIDEGRIRVVCPHVGGSFGVKIHLYPDEIATVAIARLLGRPVKFIADRIESFVSDIHAREQLVSARLALDASRPFCRLGRQVAACDRAVLDTSGFQRPRGRRGSADVARTL